jgi:hypothetical protein
MLCVDYLELRTCVSDCDSRYDVSAGTEHFLIVVAVVEDFDY